MDLSTTTSLAVAKTSPSIPQSEADMRNDLRHLERQPDLASATAPGEAPHKSSGYGLPCSKCRLYYPANIDICPTCHHRERVSPTTGPVRPTSKMSAAAIPDLAAVEKEREALLTKFKSQLVAAHADVSNSPVVCTLAEHHADGAEGPSVCKGCYERLQERVDVCEAALHIELKDAAQIVYDAVWADPSDPSKTYTNAASALLAELRKRAGVSSMIGPFQPLGN